MGGKGPPRQPTEVLKLHCSRLAPGRANEPRAAPSDQGKPYRPRALTKHPRAIRIWDYLAPILERMGTLTHADREPLAHYCVMVAQFWDAADFIAKHGATYEKTTMTKWGATTEYSSHPEVARQLRLSGELRKLERMLGITASARAGLATVAGPAGPKTAEDKLNEKFG
jgi:P27 family predicted phage terminase small subunit